MGDANPNPGTPARGRWRPASPLRNGGPWGPRRSCPRAPRGRGRNCRAAAGPRSNSAAPRGQPAMAA
eukprot:6690743-Alexandrium_andersonii.AAC.1